MVDAVAAAWHAHPTPGRSSLRGTIRAASAVEAASVGTRGGDVYLTRDGL